MEPPDRSLLPAGSTKSSVFGEAWPRRHSRATVWAGAAVLLVLALGLGFTRWAGRADVSAETVTAATVATTTVTRADISTGSSLPATLGHGSTRKITADRDGLITWLPAPGSTITRGQPVYRVNDRPVPLFYGEIPLYRELRVRGTVGRDVRVVVINLRALGYTVGTQPLPGTVITRTVAIPVAQTSTEPGTTTAAGRVAQPVATANSASGKDPDPDKDPERGGTTEPEDVPAQTRTVRRTVHGGEGVLTATVIAAIRSWQRENELPANGRLGPGAVVVRPKAFRVSALSAQVGDPASGELLSATATGKVITIEADEQQAASIDRGDRAVVHLPDSSTTPARVTSIGTALQASEGGEGSTPKLEITLALDRPEKLKRIDAAELQVTFASETHRNVLTVPVSALLALSEGGYALQPPTGSLIAVETGIFAKGMVEVSGPGVSEGLTVVTTS
jgi:hypothetical protein